VPAAANHVIIVGPQGAGKGTQASAIAPRLGLSHVATGDLFRRLLQSDTELSREVRSYYDRGALVPDELTIRVLFQRINELQRHDPSMRGVLLDGFPRNQAQAEALDAALDDQGDRIVAVAHISVPRPVLIERLTGRLTCSNCGATYHVRFNPPSTEGVCDVCGGALVQRSDDTPEAVEKRLSIYFEQTEPILEHYRSAGVLVEVDGDQSINDVTADLLAALEPIVKAA
jgi:adenylate kinase